MANFNPVAPNAQLGLLNIGQLQNSVASPYDIAQSRLAKEQAMQLAATKSQQAQAQLAIQQQQLKNAQAKLGLDYGQFGLAQEQMALNQNKFIAEQTKAAQERRETAAQEFARVYGETIKGSNATPELIKGRLRAAAMADPNLTPDDKAQFNASLDDPEKFQAIVAGLGARYDKMMKVGTSGTNQRISLDRDTLTFEDKEGNRYKGSRISSGPPGSAGMIVLDGETQPIDPKSRGLTNITGKVAVEEAQKESDIAVEEARQKQWIKDVSDHTTMANKTFNDATLELNNLTAAEGIVKSIKQGPGAPLIATIDNVKKFFGITVPSDSPAYFADIEGGVRNRMASRAFADQKGGLNAKEFEAVMSGAIHLSKSQQGNLYLIQFAEAFAKHDQARAAKMRSLLTQPGMTNALFNGEMAKWDDENKDFFPRDLYQKIEGEIDKNKDVLISDVLRVGELDQAEATISNIGGEAKPPAPQTSPLGKYQLTPEALKSGLDE